MRTTGTIVLDATAGSDAGIDVVSSEYATIAAEDTALQNLSHRNRRPDSDPAGALRRADDRAEDAVKANRGQIERALDAARPKRRGCSCYMGPDEAGVARPRRRVLGKALGADAERVRSHRRRTQGRPGAAGRRGGGDRRCSAAAATSGSSRPGDEILAAVEALMEAPAAGNPVAVAVAGNLRKGSDLLKLALAHPAAMAYRQLPAPEGNDADRTGDRDGPRSRRCSMRRRCRPPHRRGAWARDRALIAREIEKLALCSSMPAPDQAGHEIDHDTHSTLSVR